MRPSFDPDSFPMSTSTDRAIDFSALRDGMPITRRWTYLDHAAVAPLSLPAREALGRYAVDQTENGITNSGRWMEVVERVRGNAARLIHASPDEIAFVKNTTDALGLVAEGFPWRDGDNVVSVAGEFPSNVYLWMNLASRGVTLRTVSSPEGRVRVDDLRAAVDDRTRMIAVSYVGYADGFRNDLDALGGLCREKGILLCVDAIQGLGVLPLDVSKTPVDFLAADGHKWLLSPEGAGILYCRRAHLDRLRPLGVGWNSVAGSGDFATLDFTLKDSAARCEGGSYNVAGIAALGASLAWLLEIGVENISTRVLELTDRVCETAMDLGARVASSRKPGEKSGIVSLEFPGQDHEKLRRICRRNQIVVSCREGRLRISPHFYNTIEELDCLVDVLASATK